MKNDIEINFVKPFTEISRDKEFAKISNLIKK